MLIIHEDFVKPCDVEIRLYNPNGGIVLIEKIENINVNTGAILINGTDHLSAGVYNALIICGENSFVKKLIKIN
jgi:hypothetical protein